MLLAKYWRGKNAIEKNFMGWGYENLKVLAYNKLSRPNT